MRAEELSSESLRKDRSETSATRAWLLFALALFVAAAFGAVLSVVHGNSTGARASLGNVSAPWLALPCVLGALAGRGRLPVGGVVGVVTTEVALLAFYATNTVVLSIGLVVAIRSGVLFMTLGAVSGAVAGVIGALWHRTRSPAIVAVGAGLLVLEPIVQLLYQAHVNGELEYFSTSDLYVLGPEFVVGVGLCVLLYRCRPAR